MADRYCTCGAKTPYIAKAPTFCSSCGQPFVKAFVATKSSSEVQTTENTRAPVTARPIHRDRPSDNDLDSTQYDENEVAAYARELAASISPSDFFTVTEAPNAGLKLSDVLNKDKQIDIGHRGGVVVDPSQLPSLPE